MTIFVDGWFSDYPNEQFVFLKMGISAFSCAKIVL